MTRVEPVKQRFNGCFMAVIAMLTGIDYDVLPNITMNFLTDGKPVSQQYIDSFVSPERWPTNTTVVGWRIMQHYMRYNYGVALSFTRKKPKVPAGRVWAGMFEGHIVVEMPDGSIIDPNDGYGPIPASIALAGYASGMRPIDLWIIARPL